MKANVRRNRSISVIATDNTSNIYYQSYKKILSEENRDYSDWGTEGIIPNIIKKVNTAQLIIVRFVNIFLLNYSQKRIYERYVSITLSELRFWRMTLSNRGSITNRIIRHR